MVNRNMAHALRIGAVNYLNSKPLIEGLSDAAPASQLVLDYPGRLADRLADGGLDAALIPSFEYLRNPNYALVSDACVAARGPVMSVKLYFRVPPGEVRTLALDEGSRTSAALARVMLFKRFGVEPKLEALPIGRPTGSVETDAVLLIGDRAMHAPVEEFHETWDLGDAWYEWTGLPFVFAVWAVRDEDSPALRRNGRSLNRDSREALRLRQIGADNDRLQVADNGVHAELARVLTDARDRGVGRLADIARREAAGLGVEEQTAIDYLTRNLHFTLGSAEKTGLRLFEELTRRSGILKPVAPKKKPAVGAKTAPAAPVKEPEPCAS